MDRKLKEWKQFLLMPFVTYRAQPSLFSARNIYHGSATPGLGSFADCDPWENAAPLLGLRSNTAQAGAVLEEAWLIAGHRHRLQLRSGCASCRSGVTAAFLFILCSFCSASKMFAFFFVLCVPEKEQQWGFALLLCHLFQVFWLSTLISVF